MQSLAPILMTVATFVAIGCEANNRHASHENSGTPIPTTAWFTAPEWDASLFEGGYMFQDYSTFSDYARKSEFIGVGTLASHDHPRGTVTIRDVLHGKQGTQTAHWHYDIGVILPKPGDQVIVLLRHRKGQLKLNAFCGAGGLYHYSKALERAIRKALTEDTSSSSQEPDKKPGGVRLFK